MKLQRPLSLGSASPQTYRELWTERDGLEIRDFPHTSSSPADRFEAGHITVYADWYCSALTTPWRESVVALIRLVRY